MKKLQQVNISNILLTVTNQYCNTVPIGYAQLQKEFDLSTLMSQSGAMTHGVDLGNGAQLSITTIDTKTGEIKQINQEELAQILADQANKDPNNAAGDNKAISQQELKKILENIPQNGDLQQIQAGVPIIEHILHES